MPAEQSLREGRVEEALTELQDHVRKAPDNAEYRVFLFQLLCVLGDWERARAQLKVLGELNAGSLALMHVYGAAIACELLRGEVFAGARTPLILGEPLPWVALLFQALSELGLPRPHARLRRGYRLRVASGRGLRRRPDAPDPWRATALGCAPVPGAIRARAPSPSCTSTARLSPASCFGARSSPAPGRP